MSRRGEMGAFCSDLPAAAQASASTPLEVSRSRCNSPLEGSRSRHDSRGSRQVDLNTKLHFPMRCVAVEVLLARERMPSHGELLRLQLLQEPGDFDPVHFVSHQWLSRSHPDPRGVQLRCLQRVFRRVAAGEAEELFHPEMWKSWAAGGDFLRLYRSRATAMQGASLTAAEFAEDMGHGIVWLDFASVPQLCDVVRCEDVAEQSRSQQAAVASISAYLERTDFFWILAPSASHSDEEVRHDFYTYRRRVWCRFEECINFLSIKTMMPLVVTESARLTTYSVNNYLFHIAGNPKLCPFNGEASCCEMQHSVTHEGHAYSIPCDKEQIFKLLDTMHEAKVRALASQQSTHVAIIFTAAGLTFLMRAPQELKAVRSKVLQRLHQYFGADAAEEAGFTPSHMAVLLRDVEKLRDLLACGTCEPLAGAGPSGTTPLMYAAALGRADAAEAMLASGMVGLEEINAQRPTGFDLLRLASCYGHAGTVQALLSWRACVNSQAMIESAAPGFTPLHFAAGRGHAECCQVLLQQRADIGLKSAKGATPLHAAMEEPLHVLGDPEAGSTNRAIRLILLARGSLEEQDMLGQTPLELARLAVSSRIEAVSRGASDPPSSPGRRARRCWCWQADGG